MKSLITPILLAGILFTAACKKDKDPEPEVKKSRRLKSINQVGSNGPVPQYIFEYNSYGNVTKVQIVSFQIFFTYDANQRLISDSTLYGAVLTPGVRKHIYNSNNQLQRSEYREGASTQISWYIDYTWENNRITRIVETYSTGKPKNKTYISYDGSGNVSLIETQSPNQADTTKRDIVYTGKSYDDKINYLSTIHGVPAFFIPVIDLAHALSAHNPLNTGKQQDDFSYEYDAENYPVKKTHADGQLPNTFTYKTYP